MGDQENECGSQRMRPLRIAREHAGSPMSWDAGSLMRGLQREVFGAICTVRRDEEKVATVRRKATSKKREKKMKEEMKMKMKKTKTKMGWDDVGRRRGED